MRGCDVIHLGPLGGPLALGLAARRAHPPARTPSVGCCSGVVVLATRRLTSDHPHCAPGQPQGAGGDCAGVLIGAILMVTLRRNRERRTSSSSYR